MLLREHFVKLTAGPIRTEQLMKSRIGALVACFPILAVAVSTMPAIADSPTSRQPPTRHLIAAGLGAIYWPGLHDQDPSASPFAEDLGRFHTWGLSLEFAYQYRIGSGDGVDALVGIDMGFLSNENSREIDFIVLPSGETLSGDLFSSVFFLTPGARFVFGRTNRWRFSAGFGAGLYVAEFADFDDDWGCYYDYDSNELWDDTTFGGYLSIGGDYRVWKNRPRWRMRFEHKIHFADFGDTAPFAPGSGALSGPIQDLFIGFVWQH
jgi:hypothetical protein